jgi:hypothetical protein
VGDFASGTTYAFTTLNSTGQTGSGAAVDMRQATIYLQAIIKT